MARYYKCDICKKDIKGKNSVKDLSGLAIPIAPHYLESLLDDKGFVVQDICPYCKQLLLDFCIAMQNDFIDKITEYIISNIIK